MFNSNNSKYPSIINALIVKENINIELCILLGGLYSLEAYELFREIICYK